MESFLLHNIKDTFSKVAIILFTITALFTMILTCDAIAFTKDAEEKSVYELQAELVYNFSKHVRWIGTNKNIKRLCIVEDNPVIQYIKRIIKNDDSIIIERRYENHYLDDCNILFINNLYQGHLKKILSRVNNNSVLTISNKKGFVVNGGMVQFAIRGSRVNFLINKRVLDNSNIEINRNIIAISDIFESG